MTPLFAETIAAAALLVNGEVWTLPRPARHHHLVMAWLHVNTPAETTKSVARIPDHAQGFVTSLGRFVDRRTAGVIALRAGQIPKGVVRLFSEDLW